MKNLVLEKVAEEFNFYKRRIAHRKEQFDSKEITSDEYYQFTNMYIFKFSGYLRAFRDIGLLTNKEYEIYTEIIVELVRG